MVATEGGIVMTACSRSVLACAAVLACATAALADQPIICLADLEFAPEGPVCLLAVPDGSGTPHSGARALGGEVVDATVRFRVITYEGQGPVYAYPWEDIWLAFDASTAVPCAWAEFSADEDSDADGTMQFSYPMAAGGRSEGPVTIYLAGAPAWDENLQDLPPLPIAYNSPDIDGDLAVDLTDITLFTQDLGQGSGFRSDFNYDGVINLTDITLFTPHLGAACD